MKIRFMKDFMGGLSVCIATTGGRYNELLVFGAPKRVFIPEGGAVEEPSFFIPWHQSEEFISALKEAIREYEGSTPDFSQGELKATKYHLEDLRKLLKIGGV